MNRRAWVAGAVLLVGCRGVIGIEQLDYVAADGAAPVESGVPAEASTEAGASQDAGMEATNIPETGTPDQTTPPADGGMFGMCVSQGMSCRMCCHNTYPGMPDQNFNQACLCGAGSACESVCNVGSMCPPPPGADAGGCGMCFDDTAHDPSSAGSTCQQAVANCKNAPTGGCEVVACVAACMQ